MSDRVLSLIRTYVPVAVGAFLTWLQVKAGLFVPEEAGAGLTVFLVAVTTGLYYAAARALEQRWPRLGLLLGAAKQPEYGRPPAVVHSDTEYDPKTGEPIRITSTTTWGTWTGTTNPQAQPPRIPGDTQTNTWSGSN